MATKFKAAGRTGMKNSVHFTVDEAFYVRLAAASFVHARLTALIEEFKAALDEEDKYLQLSQASDYSAEISKADTARDRLYSVIRAVVEAWLLQDSLEAQLAAATALAKIIDTYKINTKEQMDAETGRLTNFLTDIMAEAMAAHLATLGLKEAAEQLKAENEQVKTLLASRADERAQNVTGALKQARVKCDELYAGITALIEGLAVAADDTAPYETFIDQWNEEIVRIKQQTASKSTKSEMVKE